ncbi:MAG TPA: HAD-IA family hydrolase [Actinomycetota bacterium]|nr:HAD-IA family hydrolase [Actinomycetota bacterium]
MRFRAVFFDAGETLVHPHPTFPDLFSRVLARRGHRVEPERLHGLVHVVGERFERAARERELWTTSPERSRAFWLDVYGIFLRELGLPERDGLAEVLYREFTDLSNYRLFEDVPPVLERLRAAGLVLGVVSNFEEWLERLLEALGVAGYFDVRVISGIEGVEKPDPGIFRLALERAGARPGESAYVGDNPVFDVEPAAAVGMFPVLIDRRDRFPDAGATRIRSMEELPAVLGL